MAGVHSGDSACVMPPQSLDKETEKEIIKISKKVAKALKIIGAANLQLAMHPSWFVFSTFLKKFLKN